MGEVLLIDYYANKGLTLVRGGNTYDLTMLNSKVGGQGSAVSYSPLQSRWGREVLSKCSDEAQKAFYWRKIQGTKLRKSFNSTVNDPNNKVDRLSAFLSNPKSDPALYAVTENCIEAVVIEEVKCIFTKVVKQYIKDNYVRFLVEGVTAKEGGKIHFPEKIKEEVLKKLPNFSTEDVTIDYSVDWENTTLKCIGFRNSVNDIFKGLKKEYKINQLKDVTKTIEKIVDNTIKNLKLGTITMDCKVKIGNFAFKKAPALKSKLKEEIEGKATLVNYNSLKSIMVSAIIDGVCWYI